MNNTAPTAELVQGPAAPAMPSLRLLDDIPFRITGNQSIGSHGFIGTRRFRISH